MAAISEHKQLLGNLCEFTQGVQIADQNTFREPGEGLIRYLYIRDLFTDKFPVYVKNQYTTKILNENDIVMVNTGNTAGTVYRGKKGVLCNNAFKIQIKRTELLNQDFLWHFLNSPEKERLLKRLFNSAGQPHVGHSNIAKLEIPILPYNQQVKIARILTTWDEAIALTERAIEAKQRQQEFLLKYLLPKNVQDGWQQLSLSKISTKPISYGIVQTGEQIEGGISCVRVIDLTARQIDPKRMITTSREINQSYKRTILEENELMIALRGEIGLVRLVSSNLVGCNLTRGVARISPDKSLVVPEYLLWALRSPLFRNNLLKRVNGSALQEIPINELRKVAVPVPPIEKQKAIARLLTVAAQETEIMQDQLDLLITQKRGLMQKLLTGEWRVAFQEAA